MDSNRISKLAEGARITLMDNVRANLARILNPESDERLSQASSVENVESLLKQKGENALIEEVAYTWFNRLCALRYMDMRGYTPVGCVTPRPGSNIPAILADAREGVFASALKINDSRQRETARILSGETSSANALADAYVLLLLAACDSYADAMGYLFSGDLRMRSAMTLLAPTDLLSEQSVLRRICDGMDAENCESVEVLGWLYQFYIAERKSEVLASKEKRSGVEDIGPATQLFTPNWIVRYLVDNSVGRLWMLNNPGSGVEAKMEYFVKPEGETEDYIKIYGPEDITVCDPACGSGHILVYAFDLLYEMYREEGYRSDQIPELILKNNLFGFEIDCRASEIASFALEMKAREKDPSFFDKNIDANITVLEPVEFESGELEDAGLFLMQHDMLDAFKHMDEIGSLYVPDAGDLQSIDIAIDNLSEKQGMFAAATIEKLRKMRTIVEVLGRRYSAVVANPPYMGTSALNNLTKNWIWSNYPEAKSDLCTCFIERGFLLSAESGYSSMVTMESWMFAVSYKSLRQKFVSNTAIVTMAHLGTRAFEAIGGEVVSTVASVFLNDRVSLSGHCYRLVDIAKPEKKRAVLKKALREQGNSFDYIIRLSEFSTFPDALICYWATPAMIHAFKERVPLSEIAGTSVGVQTGDNAKFYRSWWEVAFSNIYLTSDSVGSAIESKRRWFPLNKGGEYRKWAGNDYCVINWYNDGEDVKTLKPKETRHWQDYKDDYKFSAVITWSRIGKGSPSFRFKRNGFLSDMAGFGFYPHSRNWQLPMIAFCNSTVAERFLAAVSPGMNCMLSDIAKLPCPYEDESCAEIESLASNSIIISQQDWDEFEYSWNFRMHPIIRLSRKLQDATPSKHIEQQRRKCQQDAVSTIEVAFSLWQNECRERFNTLKTNETEINKHFAHVYKMEDEVEIEVSDDKVSVRLADCVREMRSVVSYGVGCMLGRYSLDKEGLILADQGSTLVDYLENIPSPSFTPDEDGILPILEEDWFDDDIVTGFKRWLKVAFGPDEFDQNVAYIERVLGKELRAYFVKDFFKDHCNTYSVPSSGKRPIYWLIQSPKKSFQALVYMHRMDENTITKVLTDYVRPFKQKLNAQAASLEMTGVNRDASKAAKYREIVKEMEDWERDVLYPMSQQHIKIDLDDGVKVNYPKFAGAVAKVQGLL